MQSQEVMELADWELENVSGGSRRSVPQGHHVFRCSRCGCTVEVESRWNDHYSLAETAAFPCTQTLHCGGKMQWGYWYKHWPGGE